VEKGRSSLKEIVESVNDAIVIIHVGEHVQRLPESIVLGALGELNYHVLKGRGSLPRSGERDYLLGGADAIKKGDNDIHQYDVGKECFSFLDSVLFIRSEIEGILLENVPE
jgi:hypothetical protein